jgi:hypothetical protein
MSDHDGARRVGKGEKPWERERIMAQWLSDRCGQQFVVENRIG